MIIVSKGVRFKIPINPIILGRLGSVYGTHGWLRIFSSTEKNRDIFKYHPWFIQRYGQWQLLELKDWKRHNRDFIIKIKYINDRNAANLIANYEINIDSAQLPILENNEYYWKDLIGCLVVTIEGCNLGYVYNLMKTGSNDVLVIKTTLKDTFGIKKRLIPFIYEKVIKDVDLFAKMIKVDWSPSF